MFFNGWALSVLFCSTSFSTNPKTDQDSSLRQHLSPSRSWFDGKMVFGKTPPSYQQEINSKQISCHQCHRSHQQAHNHTCTRMHIHAHTRTYMHTPTRTLSPQRIKKAKPISPYILVRIKIQCRILADLKWVMSNKSFSAIHQRNKIQFEAEDWGKN